MNTLIFMIITPLVTAFMLSMTAIPQRVSHTVLMRIRTLLSISGMTVVSVLLFMSAPSILSGEVLTYHLGGWSPFLGIALQLDALSFIVAVISVLIGFLALFYSIPHMEYMRRVGKYDAFYFLMISGIMGVLLTRDIFNMYVFLEILSISVYVLITAGEKKEGYRASLKYLILGSLSSALFLFAVGIIYQVTGSLNMDYAAQGLEEVIHSNPRLAYTVFSLIFVSLGVKAGIFPLHFWLPDAHSIAPTPVSALLSGVVLKVSIYGMIRLFSLFGNAFFTEISPVLAYTGAFTIVVGTLLALVQKDIKRLLAYSSISQIGIIITGIGIGSDLALEGALFHIVNHALLKSGLFMCAGIIAGQSGTREISKLQVRTPGVAVAFTVFSMGIAGIPPLNGFVSKFIICLGAVEAQYTDLVFVILMSSLVSCGYYFRVIQQFFGGRSVGTEPGVKSIKDREKEIKTRRRKVLPKFKLSKALSFPVYILAVVCVILGLFPLIGLGAVHIASALVGG